MGQHAECELKRVFQAGGELWLSGCIGHRGGGCAVNTIVIDVHLLVVGVGTLGHELDLVGAVRHDGTRTGAGDGLAPRGSCDVMQDRRGAAVFQH